MIVCVCNAITERDIDEAVENGATTMEALRATLRVSSQCGSCIGCAQSYLEAAVDRCRIQESRPAPAALGRLQVLSANT